MFSCGIQVISCHSPCHQNIAIVCESDVARFSLTWRGFVTSSRNHSLPTQSQAPHLKRHSQQIEHGGGNGAVLQRRVVSISNLSQKKNVTLRVLFFRVAITYQTEVALKYELQQLDLRLSQQQLWIRGTLTNPKNMSVSLFAQSWPCQVLIYWRYLSYIRPVF